MTRQCSMCEKTFPINMFYVYSNGKFSPYCKPCDIARGKKHWALNKKKSKKVNLIYINKERNFIRVIIKSIFNPSRMFPKRIKNYNRKGWVPEITFKEMYEELLLHIQLMKDKFPDTNGRLCRYCEKPWTTIRTGKNNGDISKYNFSVDRFDSNKTYMKGNVIFCCAKCNSTKKNSTKKDWLKYLEIDKELNEENKTR
jgi:hypothetical protein